MKLLKIYCIILDKNGASLLENKIIWCAMFQIKWVLMALPTSVYLNIMGLLCHSYLSCQYKYQLISYACMTK